jgi:2-phosphoglycerate kinase
MSRILTLIKVNEKDAVKITLDIKKHFVEANITDVTQQELERVLFLKLSEHSYSEHFVQRYKLITSFYQKKVPFVILICGTECMGKSTLIT